MKALTKRLIIGTVTLGLVGAGTMIAQASWTIPGTATVTAKAAAMPRGAAPTATLQGGDALISWNAQEMVSGVRMQKYVVTAHSADTPHRADIAHTIVATSADAFSVAFTGSALAGGKWYWTLVPEYALWAGAESEKTDELTFPAAADSSSVTSLVADTPTQVATPAPSTTTPAEPSEADPPKTPPQERAPATVATAPPDDKPKPVETTSPPAPAPPTSDPAPAGTTTTAASAAESPAT